MTLSRLLILLLVGLGLLPMACNSGGGTPTEPGGEEPGSVAFQGQVESVDTNTLILVGGTRILVTATTVFDAAGDLFSLGAIQTALQRGEVVTVRGIGTRRDASTIEAQEIEAETSAPGRPVQFAGVVSALDRIQGILRLRSGLLLVLDGDTVFDPGGDATGFNQLVAAFDRGDLITVQGDGVQPGDGAVRVDEIRVELSDAPGGNTQFAGVVATVDRPGQRMTLTNGVMVAVDASTRFDATGDLFSFAALASAVEQSQRIRVQGEGVFRADGSVLARQILAEIDVAIDPQ